jgi:type IV pilus assembly protein PilX
MKMKYTLQSSRFAQQGMAIVMALVFLLILTLLAVNTTNTTIMAEKMSQNMRDSTSAFQAADAALTDAESWLTAQSSAPTAVSTCSTSPTTPCNVWTLNASPLGTLSAQTTTWWTNNGRPYSSTLANVVTQPRFIIEQSSVVSGTYFYRITARGVGTSSNATVTLQSIYAVDY